MTHAGQPSKLKCDKLWKRRIDILSVDVPGAHSDGSRKKVVCKSLEIAVDHAEQREYIDRPGYQNGLDGLEMWAAAMDAGAKLADAGKLTRCGADTLRFAGHYAGCYYGACRYARDCLKMIAGGDKLLNGAAACYKDVARCLQAGGKCLAGRQWPGADKFKELARSIRDAREFEAQGIKHVTRYPGLDT